MLFNIKMANFKYIQSFVARALGMVDSVINVDVDVSQFGEGLFLLLS